MRVTRSLSQFVADVCECEALTDWTISFWDIDGESECVEDGRTIYVGEMGCGIDGNKVIFLHEVAHIGHGAEKDEENRHHGTVWRRKMIDLLKKYGLIEFWHLDPELIDDFIVPAR